MHRIPLNIKYESHRIKSNGNCEIFIFFYMSLLNLSPLFHNAYLSSIAFQGYVKFAFYYHILRRFHNERSQVSSEISEEIFYCKRSDPWISHKNEDRRILRVIIQGENSNILETISNNIDLIASKYNKLARII